MNNITINNHVTFLGNVTVNLSMKPAETTTSTPEKIIEMKTILAALTLAFAVITGCKAREDALKLEIANRDKTIVDLQAAIEANTANDQALIDAAAAAKTKQEEAEASLAQLNADAAEAETKAAELVTLINGSPEIPANVDPTTGELVPTGQDPQA